MSLFDKSDRKIRSQSITSLGSFSPCPLRFRPRSFSVDCTAMKTSSSALFYTNTSDSTSTCPINPVNEVDEDEFSSESYRETRKSSSSSISGNNGSIQKKKFNAAGTSLLHLVPNKILSSVSRRISANASHELCRCSSCNQSVTPYWRDGWSEDVMLCNACGLRFQKFAQRCMYCKYIPRKEDGVEDTCPQCQAPWEC